MIYSLETTYVPEWDITLYRINCESLHVVRNTGEKESSYWSVMAGWNYGNELRPDSIKCDVLDVIRNTYPDHYFDIVVANGKLYWKTFTGICDYIEI